MGEWLIFKIYRCIMKVLFIGAPNTGHTERFIKNLVESTTDIEVSILCDVMVQILVIYYLIVIRF